MRIAALYGVIAVTTPTGSCRRTLNATRPRDELVDRHRVEVLVRHRQVEVDGVAGERDAAAQLHALGEHRRLAGLGDHRRDERRRHSPRCGRCSACTHSGPLGAATSTATGPRRTRRRASAIARRNSASGVTDSSATWVSSAGFSTASASSPSTHRPATYDRRSVITLTCTPPVRRSERRSTSSRNGLARKSVLLSRNRLARKARRSGPR